jgi:drug/metabolite transporter (DMT)-like permease
VLVTPHTRRPPVGFALVGLGALLFIVNAGVSRVVLRAGVTPAELTTVRITGTALCLLAFCLVFRRGALRPPQGRLRWLLLLHGLVGVAALQWAYFVAIDRLPIGLALLLEYQAPLLVALWARFVQGEHLRRRAWVGLGLALLGLAMATGVLGGGLRWDVAGLLAGLAAAVCFATYFVVGEHGVAEVDPVRVVLWSFGVATVAMNLLTPVWHFPGEVLTEQVPLLGRLGEVSGLATAPGVLLVAWVVVLGTLLPFGAELAAMRHLSASVVTMVAMLEPVGVAALGWAWFREDLGLVATTGYVLVVAGIVAAQTGRATPHEPETVPYVQA